MQKKHLQNNLYNILLLVIYTGIVLSTTFFHEIWTDEAQAWLVAGDSSLLNIIKEIRIEGHPILWYLILMPLHKLHLPVISMQITSSFFMIVATAVLLWKSPFNKLIKTVIIFSPAFLYYLPIIARNYCLVPIFLFLFCIYYNKRNQSPVLYCIILLLLANTHILMFGFCFCAFLIFLFQKIKDNSITEDLTRFISIVITAIIFLSMIIFFHGAKDLNIDIVYMNSFGINISNLLTYMDLFKFYKELNLNVLYIIANISFIAFAILGLLGTFKIDKQFSLIALTGLLFQFYVYIFVWQINIQKVSLIILTLLSCYWIIYYKQSELDKKFKFALTISMIMFFALSIPISIKTIKYDILNDFSYSLKAAKALKSFADKDSVVLALGYTSPIQAYLTDLKYYSPVCKQNITYYKYDIRISDIRNTNKDKELKKLNFSYIIASDIIDDNRYKLIYAPEKSSVIEKFYLYEFIKK